MRYFTQASKFTRQATDFVVILWGEDAQDWKQNVQIATSELNDAVVLLDACSSDASAVEWRAKIIQESNMHVFYFPNATNLHETTLAQMASIVYNAEQNQKPILIAHDPHYPRAKVLQIYTQEAKANVKVFGNVHEYHAPLTMVVCTVMIVICI